MFMAGFTKATRHWLLAFRHGVGESWFGWGAAAGVVVANLIISLAENGSIVSLNPTSPWLTSWWFVLAATVVGGLVTVAIFNALVLAPFRTWRMLNPFRIKVVSGQLDSDYPSGVFPRQSVAVTIENLSYQQRSNCVLHIWQIAGFDNQYGLPRFVSEFSLLSGNKQAISFLSWTTRSPPYEDDPTFMLGGLVGPGYGGNVAKLPCGTYDIDIRISVPEADSVIVRCRVWSDDNNLRAALRHN
jgi:hypothetical protein